MLLLAAAVLTAAQTPKTFKGLAIDVIEALHGMKNFHLELDFTVTNGTAKIPGGRIDTIRDGERESTTVVNGSDQVRLIRDGSTLWAIFDSRKSYWKTPLNPKKPFDPVAALASKLANPHNYIFHTEILFVPVDYDKLIIRSIDLVNEGGESLRRVIASYNTAGSTTTNTQWFLPDKWIPKRVTIDVKIRGMVLHEEETAKVFDLNAKIDPHDFVFDPALVKGYKKLDRLPIN